ncbi:MAG: hypothetical protein IJB89_10325 [Akkermansia sp.]|nr:hypothetical protein [Akkermansia sp.]
MKPTLGKLKWLIVAAAFALPLTVTAAPTQNDREAEAMLEAAKKKDDTMLATCRNRVVNMLVETGVITPERGKAITEAAVKNSGKSNIRVKYEDGKLVFLTSAAHLVRLQQETSKAENPDAAFAEKYVEAVSKSIGTADMLLRMGDHLSNINNATLGGWEDCIWIAVQNLMLQKNIDRDTAMKTDNIPFIRNYISWDEELKIFRLKEKEFAKDAGLNIPPDAPQPAPSGAGKPTGTGAGTTTPSPDPQTPETNPDDPYADKFPGISPEIRKFWYNLKPLENKEDTTGFHNTVKAISRHLQPTITLMPGNSYEAIPFEQLTKEQSREGKNWYRGATAKARISPEYVRFYHEVIVPKYGAFMKALSTEVSVTRDKGTVKCSRNDRIYSISYKGSRYSEGLEESRDDSYFLLLTVDNPEALFNKKAGEEVEITRTVYRLPEIFTKYYTRAEGIGQSIYANMYNAEGIPVGSTENSFGCQKLTWLKNGYAKELSFSNICLKDSAKVAKTEFNFISGAEKARRAKAGENPTAEPAEDGLEIEQPEIADEGTYAGIPQSMQEFWENVELPESKQDLNWFKKFTEDVDKYTQPQFIIKYANPYKQVAFERLNSREAECSPYWFADATATLEISPEYARFYHEVIIPKYDEVLSFFATNRYESQVQGKLNDDKLQFDFADRYKGFWLYLTDVDDPEALLKANAGDMVKVNITTYILPEAFRSSFQDSGSKSIDCYAHAVDISGQKIYTSGKSFYAHWIWLNSKIRGYLNFDAFYIVKTESGEPKQEYAKTIVTLRDEYDTFGQPRPEPSAPISEKAGYLGEIIGGIFVSLWFLSIPYMVWILYCEKKRAWKMLELPEDYTAPEGAALDIEGLRSEFDTLRNIWVNLELVEIEGELYRCFVQKKEVDAGYKALEPFKSMTDLTNDEKYALNEAGAALNNAQKRVLGCGMKQFVIICLLCGFAGLMTMFMTWIIPFVYYLSMKTPVYKAANDEPWYLAIMHRLLYALGIGMFIAAAQTARGDFDPVYVDKRGNLYTNLDDKPTGCFIAIMWLMLALMLAPLLIMAQCLIHFIRNYISNR